MGEDPSAKIECLLRKAAEDPQFKELLLAERSRAAQRIGVVLDMPEAAIVDSVAEEQLKAMIAKTPRGPERTHFRLPLDIVKGQIQGIRPDLKWMGQSMEILQLPNMELIERIEQELNENPVLEVQEQAPTLPDEPVERDNPDAPAGSERELVVDGSKDHLDDFERLTIMDTESTGMFDDGPRGFLTRVEEEANGKYDAVSKLTARPESLNDHLSHQIGEMELEPDLAAMAERIISTLDACDGGYFQSSLEDLLPPDAGPEQLDLAHRALEIVQSLDPPGIAARDLRECLLRQLIPGMPYFEELQTLITSHLQDLRCNRLPKIAKRTGYTIDRILKTWEQLRKLNPKPGTQFADSLVRAVIPDVRLEQADDGTYRVVLEDARTPQLFMSEFYRRRLNSSDTTAEEREFINRKVNAAQWLIDSIEQRRGTLTRVAQAIVDYQKRFLDDGPEAIVPLKMQQIADAVGMHVTTVSRAVADKWIQTPRGMFPLTRFFVGGTRSDDGDDVAWDTIRIKLQELLDNEDKTAPLSDDDLVGELEKLGMKVARRTVIKFRQKFGIPSSLQRRDGSKKE